jgi:TatD DNase family protein
MSFKLFDSHCHLQLPAYGDAERAVIIEAARKSGLGFIAVGTNFLTSSAAVKLAEENPENVWASIAVHPGHVHAPHHDEQEFADPPTEEVFDAQKFMPLLSSGRVAAVGETGLDYYRLEAGAGRTVEDIKERQRRNFIAQITFAEEKGLPLIIHIRSSAEKTSDAQDDALEILKQENVTKGVMHCFSGTAEEAEKYLERGLHISFAGNVAFPPRKNEKENPLAVACRIVPDDRLLIETDAPWLSPPPLRGKRNEPANVKLVAEAIGRIRHQDSAEISRITAQNAIRLFSLAKLPKP